MTLRDDPPDALADLDDILRRDPGVPAGRSDAEIQRRRRRRRRGLLATALVFALILAAGAGYAAWALNRPLPAPTVQSQVPAVPVGPAAVLDFPAEASAAISVTGAEAYLGTPTDTVWMLSGSEEPRPIASLSKLVTALVVLAEHPLAGPDDAGPTIRFTEADHDLYDEYYVQGATIAAMPRGSSMSLRDALATMLIPSASNYAHAVSTWAFGSQGAFAGAARRWLDGHGLTATNIVEPTGVSPRNTSTPRDLMVIAQLAAADPTIASIVATPALSLPGPGPMKNTNNLLGVQGIDGLKTGNLGPGSYHLLYTATVEVGAETPIRVTGVIVGGGSRESVSQDVLALLTSIDNGFHEVSVVNRGREVGSIATPWGSTATIVVSDDVSIFTWSDTPITVTMDLTDPVTYQDGEPVGTLTWTAGPRTASTTLEIEGDIEPPDEWWRLTHPDELGG